ncbi:MAG: hypothetical protein JW727_06720 [Candidatus Aenigmarchaeota archaeon]|nr:hypothetical protein [Candidatus Aenigmarchaeota archaeon]
MIAQDIQNLRFTESGREIDPSAIFTELYSGLGELVAYNVRLSRNAQKYGSRSDMDDLINHDRERSDLFGKWKPPQIASELTLEGGRKRSGYVVPRRDSYYNPYLAQKTPSMALLVVEDENGKELSPLVLRQSRVKYTDFEAKRMSPGVGVKKPGNLTPVSEANYVTATEGLIDGSVRSLEDIKNKKKIPRIIPKMIPFSVSGDGEILWIRNYYPSIGSIGFDDEDLASLLGAEWGVGVVDQDRGYFELCTVPRGKPIFDIDPDYRLFRSGDLEDYRRWRNFIGLQEFGRTMDCLNGLEEKDKSVRKILDSELRGLKVGESRRAGIKQHSLRVMDAVSQIKSHEELERLFSQKVDEGLVRDTYGDMCLF